MKRVLELLERHCGLANIVVFAMLMMFFLCDRFIFLGNPRHLDLKGWDKALYPVIPWVFAGMIPLWVLGRHARFVYLALAPVAIILECIEWFTRSTFAMTLTGSWVGIAMSSSFEEVKWFLAQYLSVKSVFLTLLIGAFIAIACRTLLGTVRRAKVSRATLVASFFAVLLFVYETDLLHVPFYRTARVNTVAYLVVDTVRSFSIQRKLARMKVCPQLPEEVHSSSSADDVVTGVFVLGESASRNHMGIYGYGRDTTPMLTSIREELTVFSDLVALDGATGDAMRSIFTTRTAEASRDVRYSLSQALRKCGFDVALYSNQRRWDAFDSDETYSFAGCDPFLCMSECGESDAYDGVLLQYLDRGLDAMKGNRVAFLHLMGSHSDFRDRYPWENLPFGVETNKAVARAKGKATVDDYDNSIWYTDKILGDIVQRLKALHKPAWMIYISDHGETPSAKGWRTMTDRDLWEIPFVVWTSPGFNAAYPERVAALRQARDKPLQSDQLLYGLLRFMGVEGLGNAPEEDFLDESFKPRRPRLIQGGETVYQPKAFGGR